MFFGVGKILYEIKKFLLELYGFKILRKFIRENFLYLNIDWFLSCFGL